jgi:hypothetical protein
MMAATHVTGRKAIQMAVLAGADTIEHRDGALDKVVFVIKDGNVLSSELVCRTATSWCFPQ